MRLHGTSRLLAVSLIALASLIAVATTMAATKSSKTYVIASTNALTGGLATTGGPTAAGARTAVRYINANGGVKGSGAKLSYQVLDDGAVPQQGIANAKALLQKKPVTFLGHASSVVDLPVQALLDKAQIPLIDATGIPQVSGDRWNFHLQASTGDEYVLAADYFKKYGKSKGRRVALMIVRTPAQTAQRAIFKPILAGRGWNIVTDQDYLVSDTSLAAQAQKIAETKPDYIIAGVIPTLVPGFMQALKAAGVSAPVVNFSPGSDISGFKGANTNQFMALTQLPSPNLPGCKTCEKMLSLAKKYGTASQATSFYFTVGWVGVHVVAAGLAKANCGDNCTGAKVLRGIEQSGKIDVGDLVPPLEFGRTDHGGVSAARVYRYDAKKGLPLPISPFIKIAPRIGA